MEQQDVDDRKVVEAEDAEIDQLEAETLVVAEGVKVHLVVVLQSTQSQKSEKKICQKSQKREMNQFLWECLKSQIFERLKEPGLRRLQDPVHLLLLLSRKWKNLHLCLFLQRLLESLHQSRLLQHQ
jgi:hypothetical protein